MKTIVIGDIHGCFFTFANLLAQVKYIGCEDTLILLGDYIDRGPHSYKAVNAIIDLQSKHGKDRVICLRGNHEQFVIDNNGFLDYLWACNGGNKTINSYERNGHEIAEHLSWFKSLPLCYQDEKFIYCHAGLTYPDLLSNRRKDLLWGRSWLEIDSRPREKTVVFGHTPMESVPFIARTGDIGIDGGCVFGGSLCAMIIYENGDYHFETIRKSPSDE